MMIPNLNQNFLSLAKVWMNYFFIFLFILCAQGDTRLMASNMTLTLNFNFLSFFVVVVVAVHLSKSSTCPKNMIICFGVNSSLAFTKFPLEVIIKF